MEFEFDEQKSRTNKAKHGLDFVEAQLLWDDSHTLEIPARLDVESRSMVIGKIGDRHWSAIVTQRGDKIRLISVRRSRKEEQELYES